MTERVGVGMDLTFPLSPRMFRQGNFDQFAEIIKKVEEFIPGDQWVVWGLGSRPLPRWLVKYLEFSDKAVSKVTSLGFRVENPKPT